MNTMKKLLVISALLVGMVSLSEAGGRSGQGWNVSIMTGTVKTIYTGSGFLRAIILSTGSVATANENFLVCYSTPPSVQNGAGTTLIPNHLFTATAAVTPAIMFLTTATANSNGVSVGGGLNNVWKLGDGPNDFLEVNGPFPAGGPESGGLHCRKNSVTGASQQSDTAAIYWSK